MHRRTFLGMAAAAPRLGRTEVAIQGDRFLINGKPTYAGRIVQGHEDRRPAHEHRAWCRASSTTSTRRRAPSGPIRTPASGTPSATRASSSRPCRSGAGTACWPSPSTCRAAARRATRRRSRGRTPPSSRTATLRPAYMERLERILDRADELGMVAIVGYFYFGQDQRVKDEAAVKRAVRQRRQLAARRRLPQRAASKSTTRCNVRAYDHEILKPARVHELIELAKGTTTRRAAPAGGHQLRRRHARDVQRRQGVGLPAAARQRPGRPGPHPQDDRDARARPTATGPCPS